MDLSGDGLSCALCGVGGLLSQKALKIHMAMSHKASAAAATALLAGAAAAAEGGTGQAIGGAEGGAAASALDDLPDDDSAVDDALSVADSLAGGGSDAEDDDGGDAGDIAALVAVAAAPAPAAGSAGAGFGGGLLSFRDAELALRVREDRLDDMRAEAQHHSLELRLYAEARLRGVSGAALNALIYVLRSASASEFAQFQRG